MNLQRLGTIVRLELLQRVRSVAWYVLLGIFALLLVGVTALSFTVFAATQDTGSGIYSTVVFITLLLAVLVSPTFSGNSINGDRDAATLAPVQVTLASTGEILIGKFLAAWATGLAFAVVALPFLAIATLGGGVSPWTVLVSLVVLIVEIGVISAVGVALSGILARPLFSVATTYLVVSALTIGTLIVFGLVGASIRSEVTSSYRVADYSGDTVVCTDEWETYTGERPRFDTVWWVLAANPFVILADATPAQFSPEGWPVDLFGQIKFGVRSAQLPPDTQYRYDECAQQNPSPATTAEEIIASTTPSWFVGLAVQIALAAGLMFWAYSRTRTPARALPPGTRIA